MLLKLIVGSLLAGLSAFGAHPAAAGTPESSIAACHGQVRARKATSGPQVATPQPSLICFGGNIDRSSAVDLVSAIEKVQAGQPLTLVVTGSSGGDMSAGLDIAETLSARDSTVVADGFCASSCANYLWLMAAHRVITHNGLLVFHGGATMALLSQMKMQIQTTNRNNPSFNTGQVMAQQKSWMAGLIARQNRLLKHAGVDADFFEFFNQVDAPENLMRQSRDCLSKPDAQALVFSPRYLESRGVTIARDDGPQTPEKVNAYLRQISPQAAEKICFWN